MKLIIEDDEGRKTVVPVVRDEITIGRQDGNTIRLTERNVSRRHARFYRENGSLVLEDLNSYNGVRVNGERISEPTKVKEGDLIEIGDYDLGIQGKLEPLPAGAAAAKPTAAARATGEVAPAKPAKKEAPAPAPAPAPAAAAPEPTPEPAPPPAPAAAPAGQPKEQAGATSIIRLSDLAKSAGPVEIRDLAKSEMPRLVGLNGQFRGKEFYFGKTEVKIGRTDENDIGIDHQSISRQHCKFTLEDGSWKVYDNKSANGVRLNGEDYAVTAIKPGDTVELGHVKFRFCAPGERFVPPAEPAATVAAAAAPARAAPIGQTEPPATPMASAAPKGGKSNTGILVGVGVGVVVLAAVAFFALRGGGTSGQPGEQSSDKMSAEDAVKQGDAAFAAHDFLKATQMYEAAAAKGTRPANLKKAKDEAPAQQSYNELVKNIASSEFDKAKAQLDTLLADPDRHWAKQAQGKADTVKQGFVKLHLANAQAAKSDSDACAREAGLALQADPSNEEAQKVAQSCKGGAARQTVAVEKREPPPKKEPKEPAGPSAAERTANATKLIGEGNALYQSRDFDGAIEKFQQAVAQKPAGNVLGFAYRGLGSAYAQKGDKGNAVKYFKAYLPFAPDAATKAQLQKLIQAYSQ